MIEPAYDDAGHFENGAAVVRTGGYYGVIGINGEEIQPAIYESVSIEDKTYIEARKGKTTCCFDLEGNKLLEGNYMSVEFSEGFFIFYDRSSYKAGMADAQGNVILEPVYNTISVDRIPGQELVIVRAEAKSGIMDLSGRIVAPIEYDWISRLTGSRMTAERDGKSEETDLTGEWKTEPEEDGSAPLQDGRQILSEYRIRDRIGDFWVIATEGNFNVYFGIADQKGNIVLPPVYDNWRDDGLIYGIYTGNHSLRRDHGTKRGGTKCRGTKYIKPGCAETEGGAGK